MKSKSPKLSIVIASLNGRPYIDACLASLAQQNGNIAAEVIVADCAGASVTGFVRAEYPEVRLIAFDERKSVPELRSAGILASRGEVVVITEDHCLATEGWYEALVRAHQAHPDPAIGGAVDNAAIERIVDWAVYFCEYSNFISPVPHGVVHDLPGPNVSYKRAALDTMRDMVERGYWETFLHQRLESAGHQLWSDPSIVVLHKKHFRFRDFLSERFHYGRWFAGTRNEFSGPLRRLFYLVFSPLLPPLIISRIARRVLGRRRHYDAFVKALPLILVFMVAWATGEFVGHLLGPGQSVRKLS